MTNKLKKISVHFGGIFRTIYRNCLNAKSVQFGEGFFSQNSGDATTERSKNRNRTELLAKSIRFAILTKNVPPFFGALHRPIKHLDGIRNPHANWSILKRYNTFLPRTAKFTSPSDVSLRHEKDEAGKRIISACFGAICDQRFMFTDHIVSCPRILHSQHW